MKKITSICILNIVLIVVLCVAVQKTDFNRIRNDGRQFEETKSKKDGQPDGDLNLPAGYVMEEPSQYTIVDLDGRLTVYYPDRSTLFVTTGIVTAHLPQTLQKDLKTGICFESKEQLYDFLESYSS